MKRLYEFYYEPLEVEPRSTYELHIVHETQATFSGDVFKVTPSGKLEPCGKFRLHKDRTELATVNCKRVWMVRISGESLEGARRSAQDLLYKYVSSWAAHLIGVEEPI